jgi:hypothetical protein
MRNDVCIPATAVFLLTAVLSFLSGCGREEQQSEQAGAEGPRNAALQEMQPQDRQREDDESMEKQQRYKAALEKSLDFCRDLKWFLERIPAEGEGKDEDYRIRRERCLATLDEYSRKACENIYANGDGFAAVRVLHVYALAELLRRDRLWIGYQGEQPLDGFWETCRREAIKSGRMSDSERPKARMFKLVLSLRPGYGVTERDLESLVETALKEGICRVAILPPFTVEEEEKFLEELESERKE